MVDWHKANNASGDMYNAINYGKFNYTIFLIYWFYISYFRTASVHYFIAHAWYCWYPRLCSSIAILFKIMNANLDNYGVNNVLMKAFIYRLICNIEYVFWLSKKPLGSDPGMHDGTGVTRVPWCMSGSLTGVGGEHVPGIPGACATCDFMHLARGPSLLNAS